MESCYEVNLYDKNNDVYTFICETKDEIFAEKICKNLGKLIKEDNILRTASDGNREPYDWCEVYDSINKRVVFTAGGIE